MSELVSILVPCYNGASYLEQALKSALKQSYRELEVVAVDDGSPDDSAEIVKALQRQDPRVRLVRHERNLGVSAAWNTAMRESKGAFLLRLAQDDLLLPDTVARMLQTFRARPDADAVYGDYRILTADERVLPSKKPVAGEETLFRTDNHIGLCVMIRRRIHESGLRYDSSISAAEDLDFFVRAFDAGFVFARCTGGPLLTFRQHERMGSVVHGVLQEIEAARILARRERSRWRRQTIYAECYHVAAYRLRCRNDWAGALRMVLSGMRRAPFGVKLYRQGLAALLHVRPRSGNYE